MCIIKQTCLSCTTEESLPYRFEKIHYVVAFASKHAKKAIALFDTQLTRPDSILKNKLNRHEPGDWAFLLLTQRMAFNYLHSKANVN